MPGTNLTREEAQTRAQLLDVESYTVDLDLTTGETHLRLDHRHPLHQPRGRAPRPSPTWSTPRSRELSLNGRALDPAEVYRDNRLQLTGLAPTTSSGSWPTCRYSRSGEGLHRFVDPADDRVYLYTQFEVPDARRVYTTFEQPDLKSVFTFTVTAPEHWVVRLERRDPRAGRVR